MKCCWCCEINIIHNDKICIVCKKKVARDMMQVYCIKCYSYMHEKCYDEIVLQSGKCPKCNESGTIGMDLKYYPHDLL